MRVLGASLFVCTAFFAAVQAAGCGSSSSGNGTGSGNDSGSACTPGQSISCTGAGGCAGGQACNSDGSGYGACQCASGSSSGASSSSGGSSSGGSSGGSSGSSGSSSGASGSSSGGGDASMESGTPACTTYTKSGIATMRMGKTAGCFELDTVVNIGVTAGPVYRLFVNDAAGGNYAGMRATCSASDATHPCTVGAAVGALPKAESVTLKGAYTYDASTQGEEFYIDAVTDDGAGTAPASLGVALTDVNRSSTQIQDAYQRVTTTATALRMYDWSPSEFAVPGASQCPYQVGFGVGDVTDGLTAGMACSNTTSQPPGQSSPSSHEILIGTEFAPGFTVSSDCRCSTNVPTVTSSTGSLAGILVWNVPAGGTGYMYVAPQSDSDMPAF